MILSLPFNTVILGLFLLIPGVLFILNTANWERIVRAFPRSMPAAWVLMGTGGCWFLWRIAHLKPVDFGDYKQWLLLLFGSALIGSFFFLKDFLAIRGFAAVILMAAGPALNSAFGLYEVPQRLLFVSAVYLLIVLALYWGTVPFKARDFVLWLYARPMRGKILGGLLSLAGTSLLITSLTY